MDSKKEKKASENIDSVKCLMVIYDELTDELYINRDSVQDKSEYCEIEEYIDKKLNRNSIVNDILKHYNGIVDKNVYIEDKIDNLIYDCEDLFGGDNNFMWCETKLVTKLKMEIERASCESILSWRGLLLSKKGMERIKKAGLEFALLDSTGDYNSEVVINCCIPKGWD